MSRLFRNDLSESGARPMSERDQPVGIGIFEQSGEAVLAEDYGKRGYSGILIDVAGRGRGSSTTQGERESDCRRLGRSTRTHVVVCTLSWTSGDWPPR